MTKVFKPLLTFVKFLVYFTSKFLVGSTIRVERKEVMTWVVHSKPCAEFPCKFVNPFNHTIGGEI